MKLAGRIAACLVGGLLIRGSRAQGVVHPTVYPDAISHVLEDACIVCHGGAEPEAGLDLAALPHESDLLRRLTVLRRLRDKVRTREMPPVGYGELDDEAVSGLVAAVNEILDARLPEVPRQPGRVTVRRLSRAEYDHAVSDLLGVTTELSATFPTDDLGYGFDNIGDALSVSSLHVEQYLAAAADLAAQVVDVADPKNPAVQRLEAEAMSPSHDRVSVDGELAHLFTAVELRDSVSVPRDGDYRLRIRCCGDQAGNEPARLAVVVDGVTVATIDVPEPRNQPVVKDELVHLTGGVRRIGLAFVNDYYRPEDPDPSRRDRNLRIDWLEVVGPIDRRPPPAGSRWWLDRDPRGGTPGARARTLLRPLLERAWRRRPRDTELLGLAQLVRDAVAAGDTFGQGLRLAVQVVFASPSFLYRVEEHGGNPRALSTYHLASRLSFFLWSSVPDLPLLANARTGALRRGDVLEAETRRMLADQRASALARNFAAQWLELRNLDDVMPDPQRFGPVDARLRASMRRETELLFETVLREQRDVFELLHADYTHLDETLARHYGVAGVAGVGFRRVPAPPGRRGVLGHASILTVTSDPTRTSVVKRGKWVLENLLDAAPPPPPPGNDSFPEDAVVDSAASLRVQMQRHRAQETCASCHRRMDALGFCLEGFDAVGRRRDGVDDRGELSGRPVRGLDGLRAFLGRDPAFLACLLRKLFTYAVGRDALPRDLLELDAVARGFGDRPVTLTDLVLAVVRADGFQRRSLR